MNRDPSGGIWLLPVHVGASRGSVASLQREFARLRALDHPHIARLLELGTNGQQYYVKSERLDGEPLRDVLAHLQPERLDVSEADAIVRAIGSALVYAHERGIAHGEVRADNVLVTMDQRVVLANFLARSAARTATRPARPADDLRALARLAAELYTGSAAPQALRGAAHGEVPAPRLSAIRAVLEAPQNRRPDDVAEFLDAAGLSRAAAPPPPLRRHAGRAQRSWSLWRLALPMAAVIAIGTAVASYHAAGEEWRESAVELQRRGLDALRAVTARSPSPAAATATADAAAATVPEPASAVTPEPRTVETAAPPQPMEAAHELAPIPEPTADPRTVAPDGVLPAQPPATTSATSDAAARPAPTVSDPAVLSLGVTKIAAREDHSVVSIDVVRSGDTTHEAAVGWFTSPDTAHEDDDYSSVGRQTLRFPAGATVERLLIPIVDDGIREGDEHFTVHLSRPRNGLPGSVMATQVTLYDND